MKKLIFLLFLLSSSLMLTAQTKDETIAWLKDKISKNYFYYVLEGNNHLSHINYKFNEIIITECSITLKYAGYEEIIPLTKSIIVDDLGFIRQTSKSLTRQDGPKEKTYSDRSFFQFIENEENLFARMTKALQHLASFCTKEKETF
jgi:hypothetical protein